MRRPVFLMAAALALAAIPAVATAQGRGCPEEPLLLNYTGGGKVVCPCFIPGEEAGSILDAPAAHYPIEILRIGIGWGSQLGGAPQTIEQAIHVYGLGLPDPGTPIFSLEGPVMTDGFINEFSVEGLDWIVDGGPFTVTIEFFNENAGDPSAPSVVHDGNGCQNGKNVVFAIPGGWFNSCSLGVTGDWIFTVAYRQVDCGPSAVGEEHVISSAGVLMMPPQPNPFRDATRIDFRLAEESPVTLFVYDVRGRVLATLLDRAFPSGMHEVRWNGVLGDGSRAGPGLYFLSLEAGSVRTSQKVVIAR